MVGCTGTEVTTKCTIGWEVGVSGESTLGLWVRTPTEQRKLQQEILKQLRQDAYIIKIRKSDHTRISFVRVGPAGFRPSATPDVLQT